MSTLKKESKIFLFKEEEFLKFLEELKNIAVVVDGQYYIACLSGLCLLRTHSESFREYMKRKRICINLGRASKLKRTSPLLLEEIRKELEKDENRKNHWTWKFFFTPLNKGSGVITLALSQNTNCLYRVKFDKIKKI